MEHSLNKPAYTLAPKKPTEEAWRALAFINLYRFAIAGLFCILILSGYLFSPLGQFNPTLFIYISSIYLVFSLIIGFQIHLQNPRFNIQVHSNVMSDIIAITLLMYASGGVESGLGMLMVVTIAGGSIVMAGRTALLFAALASIAVLINQIFMQFHFAVTTKTSHYAQTSLLGITFFATAILAHILAKRIRESEALARRRGIDLANMAQLTEHVIQRMQTGVLVVDSDDKIRLINESAWQMFGLHTSKKPLRLKQVSSELVKHIANWREDPSISSQTFQPTNKQINIMPRFARLSRESEAGVLIFLEDTSAMSQRAQKLKLASLGRLTASIAHEIRNPLGAISHAGQLLQESTHPDKNDERLTSIIAEQSKRINAIVENILRLGRHQDFSPQVILLKDFLEKFVHEFIQYQQIDTVQFSITVEPQDIQIRFDTGQLQQILSNLCENALRHSTEYKNNPKVELRGGIDSELIRPYLDIIDHGAGIDHETAQHIFEPFFTTSATGTGLGLYISRELAESNQAQLNYFKQPTDNTGCCFRITFQDSKKQIE